MLAEERIDEILKLVNEYGSVTVQKLMECTGASESTLRRDLNTMDHKKLLTKVHGGAIALEKSAARKDAEVMIREDLNQDEKIRAAKLAASFLESDDLVYLDAGTTTSYIIDFLSERNIIFVTNGIMLARKLVNKGYQVFLPGGELKAVTEAIIGEEAIDSLKKFHFTKGFWGTNGIHPKAGYTTPDTREARMKQAAMEQCRNCYIVSDATKIGAVAPVTFAAFEDAKAIVAGQMDEAYEKFKNIIHI